MLLSKRVRIAIYLSFLISFNFGESASGRRKVRIVNGNEAEKGMFPFVGALMMKSDESLKYFCTFSIITEQTALTAAHCLFTGMQKEDSPLNVSQICGIVGIVDLDDITQCYRFSKKNVHQEFVIGIRNHDIATLIFENKLQFNEYVNKIPLLRNGIRISGKEVTVIGWGRLHQDDPPGMNKILHYVNLKIVSNAFCRIMPFYKFYCIETKIKGTCKGDSGGPGIIDRHGINVQIGVTSYLFTTCAYSYSASVFASKYDNWIKENSLGTPEFVN